MNITLREEDARAVDLLLDHGSSDSSDTPRFTTAHAGQNRLRIAERILGLLGAMADVDPPQDLVMRTLERIDQPQEARMDYRPGAATLMQSQPHA